MRKFLKMFFIAVGVLIGLALLLMFLPYVFGLLSKDIPPPDTSDLNLQTINIKPEENAYYDLEKIGLITPREVGKKVLYEIYQPAEILTYLEGTSWNQLVIDEVIAKNQKVFEIFDMAMQKPYFQDPATDRPEKLRPDLVLPSQATLLRLARVNAIRALDLHKKGEHGRAIDEAVKIVEFGHKIESSQVVLSEYLAAVAVKNIGLSTLKTILSDTNLPKDLLISYSKALERFKQGKGLVTAFKAEYAIQSAATDLIESGQLAELGGENFLERQIIKHWRGNIFYFRPNETRKLFADFARIEIDNAKKPCAELLYPEDAEIPSLVQLYFTENAVGKILQQILLPIRTIHYKRCELELLISVNQILLALRAYNLEEGELPEKLDILVPAYLTSVPIDPFNGKQIGYSKTKRIIYSVGRDGRDDGGGNEQKEWREAADPTFKIPF